MAKRGRAPKTEAEQRGVLIEIVKANPTATLEEIRDELARRTGVPAHEQMLVAALHEAGWERSRDGSGVRINYGEPRTKRYEYTDAHRRGQCLPQGSAD